jgi:hypothetical protein
VPGAAQPLWPDIPRGRVCLLVQWLAGWSDRLFYR